MAAGAVLAFVTRRVNPGSVATFVWRARAPPSCLRKGNVFSGERRFEKMYVIEIRMWILARFEIAERSRALELPVYLAASGNLRVETWQGSSGSSSQRKRYRDASGRGISLFTRNTRRTTRVLYNGDNISSPLFHFSSRPRMEFVQSPL